MDAQEIHQLAAALARRDKIRDTDAYRLFSGASEGISGLVADRYGDILVLQVRTPGEKWKSIAEWFLTSAPVRSVYLKHFIADRSHSSPGEDAYSPVSFAGQEAPPEIEIRERERKYLIKPYDGFSTGLFLDQRNNRSRLGELARGKRVLNLFSYTCSFSVACALGGGEVTSVDVSPKFLQWGRKNFEVNAIEPRAHRFISEDAIVFLKKEARRGNRYGLVIVDPPSFGRDRRGANFSLKRDFSSLLRLALNCLAPGGKLFFSCNLSDWSSSKLVEMARKTDERLQFLSVPSLPEDFQWEESPISYCLMSY